jgi:hypothetical protein
MSIFLVFSSLSAPDAGISSAIMAMILYIAGHDVSSDHSNTRFVCRYMIAVHGMLVLELAHQWNEYSKADLGTKEITGVIYLWGTIDTAT